MIQTISKTITFDEFVAWYPENSVHKYELHNGVIVEMPLGTGDHSDVTGFISSEINSETGFFRVSVAPNASSQQKPGFSGFDASVPDQIHTSLQLVKLCDTIKRSRK